MIIIGTTIDNVDVEKLWDLTIENMTKEYPTFFNKVTVEDAIGNMPSPTIDGKIANPEAMTDYQRYLASSNDILSNHTKTNHSKLAVDRMSRVDNGQNFTALKEEINSVHSGSYGRFMLG